MSGCVQQRPLGTQRFVHVRLGFVFVFSIVEGFRVVGVVDGDSAKQQQVSL